VGRRVCGVRIACLVFGERLRMNQSLLFRADAPRALPVSWKRAHLFAGRHAACLVSASDGDDVAILHRHLRAADQGPIQPDRSFGTSGPGGVPRGFCG
jgi:hypothetical protein